MKIVAVTTSAFAGALALAGFFAVPSAAQAAVLTIDLNDYDQRGELSRRRDLDHRDRDGFVGRRREREVRFGFAGDVLREHRRRPHHCGLQLGHDDNGG